MELFVFIQLMLIFSIQLLFILLNDDGGDDVFYFFYGGGDDAFFIFFPLCFTQLQHQLILQG